MKKPSPIYMFVVLISLTIAAFGFSIIFVGLGSMGFILPIVLIVGVAGFFMYIAKSLNTGQFEERLKIRMECPYCHQEIGANSDFCPLCGKNLHNKVECDYCGHFNDFEATQCIKCKANLK